MTRTGTILIMGHVTAIMAKPYCFLSSDDLSGFLNSRISVHDSFYNNLVKIKCFIIATYCVRTHTNRFIKTDKNFHILV